MTPDPDPDPDPEPTTQVIDSLVVNVTNVNSYPWNFPTPTLAIGGLTITMPGSSQVIQGSSSTGSWDVSTDNGLAVNGYEIGTVINCTAYVVASGSSTLSLTKSHTVASGDTTVTFNFSWNGSALS